MPWIKSTIHFLARGFLYFCKCPLLDIAICIIISRVHIDILFVIKSEDYHAHREEVYEPMEWIPTLSWGHITFPFLSVRFRTFSYRYPPIMLIVEPKNYNLYWACSPIFISIVCRTKTMRQLLCFKSKLPNHFAFTLGRYLFLLFFITFI